MVSCPKEVVGVPEDLLTVYKDLDDEYSTVDWTCVHQLQQDVASKGPVWGFTNISLHLLEIEDLALESLGELITEMYESAGSKMGKAFALIAPVPANY